MEIEQAPSLVFFSEDVHEEGLKVEGLYPYHIYTYIINELMGKPIEKNLPPKLETYIQQQQLVTMEELLTIYEWPEKLLNKELKKLAIQQKSKNSNIQMVISGNLKCLKLNLNKLKEDFDIHIIMYRGLLLIVIY